MSPAELPNRREVLASGLAALGTLTVASRAGAGEPATRPSARPTLCLFSKPLHNRKVEALPEVLAALGVDSLDLTCRPGGHALPERVKDDLPRAYELLKGAGISVPMVTSAITDASKDHAEDIVRTVAAIGVRNLKLGYYRYADLHDIQASLADARTRLKDVVALCRQYGVHAGFHNHSGLTIGSAVWDVHQLIADMPPDAIGSYFDAGHATVEGGDAGWRIGLNLLAPRITMLAVKDFLWERDQTRGWRPKWCPLGTGMVRWEEVLRRLKEERFAGPVSLHVEYGAQGEAGSPEDEQNLAAIRSDMKTLRELAQRVRLG